MTGPGPDDEAAPGAVVDASAVAPSDASERDEGTFRALESVALHPAAVVIWRIMSVGWVLALAVVAFAVLVLVGSRVGLLVAGVVAAALLALAWVVPARRYRYWRYAIGDDALEIHRGVWTRTTSAVPFHRIQQIDVAQGPLQRRHGVATLQLRTAAAASDGTVPHLDADDAAALRAGLLRVAARVAGDDGH